MSQSVMQLVAEAKAAVPAITPAEVIAMDAGAVLIVDVREDREVAASGKAAGAIHASRGTHSPTQMPSTVARGEVQIRGQHRRGLEKNKTICRPGRRSSALSYGPKTTRPHLERSPPICICIALEPPIMLVR